MRQLIHNGILIPKYDWKGLEIAIKGEKAKLTPKQEEMAVAWVRKLGTDYVNDKIFADNFLADFCAELGLTKKVGFEDFDFSSVINYVQKERNDKLSLSKEERKRLREERKKLREANKEKYGYAIVDGIRTEISNYTAEPSCIFMGRGKHPLRGRWKEGPNEEDIELNLVNAPEPPGKWKSVREPDVMWIARWRDKLSGEMRYVWLAENSSLKQRKEIEKFEKARELQLNINNIKHHIMENLNSADLRRRKVATVCFLIDRLKIRVGDEKDHDEADTVGASTLRPEHVKFNDDGKVTFNFLGKDSVPHVFKEGNLPDNVVSNLKEFASNTSSILFDGVDSKRVSEFLDEVASGLSAKVFRTFYASDAVKSKLNDTKVKAEEPDYVKKHVATMANLEAAKTCNHKRSIPKTWESSLLRQEERLQKSAQKAKMAQEKVRQKIEETEDRFTKQLAKQENRLTEMQQQLERYQQQLNERKQNGKPASSLVRRVSAKQRAISVQRARISGLKAKRVKQVQTLRDRLDNRQRRDKATSEKLRLQIKAKKETRDYNLGTSLKSYVDPRIYYNWGKKVNYDWKLYYPKALQKKFSWVETNSEDLT